MDADSLTVDSLLTSIRQVNLGQVRHTATELLVTFALVQLAAALVIAFIWWLGNRRG